MSTRQDGRHATSVELADIQHKVHDYLSRILLPFWIEVYSGTN